MRFNYKFITPVIFKKYFVSNIKKLNENDVITLEKNNLIYSSNSDFVSKKGLKEIDSLNEHLNKELGYKIKYNGYSKEVSNNTEMNFGM